MCILCMFAYAFYYYFACIIVHVSVFLCYILCNCVQEWIWCQRLELKLFRAESGF